MQKFEDFINRGSSSSLVVCLNPEKKQPASALNNNKESAKTSFNNVRLCCEYMKDIECLKNFDKVKVCR